jgi:hypothetical protein
MSVTCANCHKPSPDGAPLCSKCIHTFEVALANIAVYASELDTVRSRQTAFGDRAGTSRSAEKPLPVDLRVHPVEWDARSTLLGWVDFVTEHRGEYVGIPVVTIEGMAEWLTASSEWLRHRNEAPDALDEIIDLERRLGRLVDAPAERWYAGPCTARQEHNGETCRCACHNGAGVPCDMVGGCGLAFTQSGTCETDMYARAGSRTVKCPECDVEYNVDARREWLLDAAEDQLAPAMLIARAVATLAGADITPELVRKWAERGRISVRSHDTRGKALYRVGDVLDVIAQEAAKPAKRRAG